MVCVRIRIFIYIYILYELIIALFIRPIRIKVEIYCVYSFALYCSDAESFLRTFGTMANTDREIGVASFSRDFHKSTRREFTKNDKNVEICIHTRKIKWKIFMGERANARAGIRGEPKTHCVYLRVKQLLPLHKII